MEEIIKSAKSGLLHAEHDVRKIINKKLELRFLFQYEIYRTPKEDSHLKECEGLYPMSRWEMNAG